MIGLAIVVVGSFFGASKALRYAGLALFGGECMLNSKELDDSKRAMQLGFNPEMEKKRLAKKMELLKKGIPAIDAEAERKRTDLLPVVLQDENLPEHLRGSFPRRLCLTEDEAWNLYAKLNGQEELLKFSLEDLMLVSESRLEDSEVREAMEVGFQEAESNL